MFHIKRNLSLLSTFQSCAPSHVKAAPSALPLNAGDDLKQRHVAF